MRAVRRVTGAPTVSALERAAQAWRGQAAVVRSTLRERGVRGELRTLDEMASGARGKSAPRGLATFAKEMRDGGVPLDEATERLTETARVIAMLVYADHPPGAA